ncbi:MAG: BREX-3 system phosphatase PglZ [Nitrospirae bacterium]|nr:MAG: BREX-3 system phosphatase PglZ [Nitrospirota bacterium]
MGNWRDQILSAFVPQIARLTLVADPDGLLLEEGVLDGIRERGFELIPFEDPVAFRYAYESKFRSRWDRGEETDLVAVLRSPSSDLDVLPYDLLRAGRKLSFNLGDLFPNLSYPVVAALDRADLDALFDAQTKYAPGQLGENATKDFILRHVFDIAPELIKQPADLLRVLLRRHYLGQRIPSIFDKRFIQLLHQTGRFEDWPLELIVPRREVFFAFLQERWPMFLDRMAAGQGAAVKECRQEYILEIAGPTVLPFDDDDVRIYVDNLFLEGMLQPVPHEHAGALEQTWVTYGIKSSPVEDRRRRIEGLLDAVENTLPAKDAHHEEWLYFAYRWAELVALVLETDISVPEWAVERLRVMETQIDSAFTAWVVKRYANLIHLPPVPPVMLHHIPRSLARSLEDDSRAKIAFLLLDGLALGQWIVVRKELTESHPLLQFREHAVFAWVPTITPVSRQATFAGKPPVYFPDSINTTAKEESLWGQFWIDQGINANQIAYAKGLGDGDDMDYLSELLSRPKLRVAGLVIDKVDRIMHGMELGAAGMHNQVRQWTQQGFMRDLIDLLHDHGFQVYLASDHGNIEAKGVGRPAEGAVADVRGERVRVYSDARLRAHVKENFPDSLEWPAIGLPEDYLPLLASNRTAFVQVGKQTVGHGGANIEELIVPFVAIERKKINARSL